MKNYIIVFFVCICLSATGQDSIQNSTTPEHQQIAGTKVQLIPPDGFTIASNFKGFQHNESGSSIMVVEMPGSIYELIPSFTKEALLSKGIEVEQVDTLIINERWALRIVGKQSNRGVTYRKQILITGSEKETMMINCASPDGFDEIESEIADAVLSVIYQEELSADPREGIDFEIIEDGTRFKFAKGIMLTLMYTYDGLLPTNESSGTVLILGKSFSEIESEDHKRFCIDRFKQTPFEDQEILSIEPITLDSISGYAITAEGLSPTKKVHSTIYQVILFSDNMYYILVGTTYANDGRNLEEIKKAIATFHRI